MVPLIIISTFQFTAPRAWAGVRKPATTNRTAAPRANQVLLEDFRIINRYIVIKITTAAVFIWLFSSQLSASGFPAYGCRPALPFRV